MTEANVLLEHALLLLAQTPGADSRVLDQVYNNLATVRIFQKNIPEAESLLKRALTLRKSDSGPTTSISPRSSTGWRTWPSGRKTGTTPWRCTSEPSRSASMHRTQSPPT